MMTFQIGLFMMRPWVGEVPWSVILILGIIALVIYIVVHLLGLDKLDKKKS